MDLEYDLQKNHKNEVERNLSFELVRQFNFEKALVFRDERHKTEIRMKAISEIKGGIFTLIYTMRGKNLRVISLRPASREERVQYES